MAAKSISEITDDLSFAFLEGKNLEIDINLHDDRIIIFSDHHRGKGGGADDFRKSVIAYKKALSYYLANNYRLILLGDVEELWENHNFQDIYNHYEAIYELEKKFFEKNIPGSTYYIRCFGNHDYRYAFQEFVKADLDGIAQLKGIEVYEGIKMNMIKNDTRLVQVYLSHGHQGHYPRNIGVASSNAVAAFGEIQRLTHIPTNRSLMQEAPLLKRMRLLTNGGYLKWAHRMKIPVVYGHTHEAVFNSKRIFDGKRIIVEENDASDINTLNNFNTGCCSFIDGEITGIEIRDGFLSLIKWVSDSEETGAIPVFNKAGEESKIDISLLVTKL